MSLLPTQLNISKLFIRRLADNRITFNWDRGEDVPADDDLTGAIVDFLAGGLANHIYRQAETRPIAHRSAVVRRA